MRILVDADACPVKDEIYRVAWRHEVPVTIVSNSAFRIPNHPLVTRQVVSDAFDAADDWIAEASAPDTIVVTADILLADRALKAGATVLAPPASPSPPPRSAALSPPARFWRTCARAVTSSAAPRPPLRRTARASCRRSTRRSGG